MLNERNNTDGDHSESRRVELKVLGVSYSQIQSGAYALILAEIDGPMRVPVVVGGMEAQSVAIKLEGIIPPRPLTHDLFASLMHAFNLQLLDVYIYKFEDGIFSSEMTIIDNNGKEVKLDARTSDAIAIAMRVGAPIYTTKQIIAETGFMMEMVSQDSDNESLEDSSEATNGETSEISKDVKLAQLRDQLAKAIEEEAYEEASRITREINALENQ